MSPTPPVSPAPRSPTKSSANAAGDGVHLNMVEARGAQRNGAIWILVISLSLAIVVLGGYWLIRTPKMAAVNHPSGQDLNARDVRTLYGRPTVPTAAATPNAMGGG